MKFPRIVPILLGTALAIGGALLFIFGLATFAASKGQSVEHFGAVLLGYGTLLMGIYVSPQLRQGTENMLSALRRMADRFFDF